MGETVTGSATDMTVPSVMVVADGALPDALVRLAACTTPALRLVPATLAQAARDPQGGPVLCLHPAPGAAVAGALARGVALPDALAGWCTRTAAFLADIRPLRRRLTLIPAGAVRHAPADLARALAARLRVTLEEDAVPPASDADAEAPPQADALLQLVATAALAADPSARALLAEVEATALPLPYQDAPGDAVRGLAQLRALLADSGGRGDLQDQIAAMAREIAQLETALDTVRQAHGRSQAEAAGLRQETARLADALAAVEAEAAEGAHLAAALRVERDAARSAAAEGGAQADALAALQARHDQAQAARLAAEQARDAAVARLEAQSGDLAGLRRQMARQGARDAVLGAEILRLARALEAQRAAAEAAATALAAAEARCDALQAARETGRPAARRSKFVAKPAPAAPSRRPAAATPARTSAGDSPAAAEAQDAGPAPGPAPAAPDPGASPQAPRGRRRSAGVARGGDDHG